jgi:hypothetical protein
LQVGFQIAQQRLAHNHTTSMHLTSLLEAYLQRSMSWATNSWAKWWKPDLRCAISAKATASSFHSRSHAANAISAAEAKRLCASGTTLDFPVDDRPTDTPVAAKLHF